MQRRGRFFEDYAVGELVRHWPGRTIRDADDTWFSLLTMNNNPSISTSTTPRRPSTAAAS